MRAVFPAGVLALPFLVGVIHSRRADPAYAFGSQNSYQAYVIIGLLHLLIAHVAGVPDEVDEVQPALVSAALSAFGATAIWVIIQTVSPGLLPRWVIFVSAAAIAAWSFLCSFVSVHSQRQKRRKERMVALLLAGETADFEAEASRLFPPPEVAFSVAAMVTLDGDDDRTRSADQLRELVSVEEPNLVVVSDAASQSNEVVEALTVLHRNGIKVRTLSMFYDEFLGKVSLSELTRMAMLFDVRNLHHNTYRRVKRSIDLVGALGAGLVCFLVVIPVMIGNAIANRGPLLFRQQRVGLNGVEFTIIKFRTMVPTPAEEVGAWTRPDDPRVTPFGRLLRRSHVDELPQFWNIFRGELCLVGPRPEQPRYVMDLCAKEPAYELRHLVTPGMTGWAQVRLRYADTEAAAIEKLQYDLYYLIHQSLGFDLKILSRTIRSVLRRRGR
jgi:lipopolysaccharide/colanic/teichoic acid biosynthesis glycosyltransferase